MKEQEIVEFLTKTDNIDNYTTRELYQKYHNQTHDPVTKNIFTRTLKKHGVIKISARNINGVTTKYRVLKPVKTTCPNCHGTGIIEIYTQ